MNSLSNKNQRQNPLSSNPWCFCPTWRHVTLVLSYVAPCRRVNLSISLPTWRRTHLSASISTPSSLSSFPTAPPPPRPHILRHRHEHAAWRAASTTRPLVATNLRPQRRARPLPAPVIHLHLARGAVGALLFRHHGRAKAQPPPHRLAALVLYCLACPAHHRHAPPRRVVRLRISCRRRGR